MSFAERKKQFLTLLADVGSVTVAARQLGVNRNTGYSWARSAGIKSTRIEHPSKAEYLKLRDLGLTQRAAAEQAGVHPRSGRDWERGIRRAQNGPHYPDGRFVDSTTGQTKIVAMDSTVPVAGAVPETVSPRLLSLSEREQIADLRRAGRSLRAIGEHLGRAASTIKRELDAHTSDQDLYLPSVAHRRSALSRSRPKTAKLARPGPLRDAVASMLAEEWSPEQISGILPRQFPDDEAMRVSTETIYQAIYVQARGGLKREIRSALRTGCTRRKPHRSVAQRQPRFKDPMIMISDRPAEIEDRAVPGHWEGDLIMGAANKSAIVTLVERSTRYVMLGHLPAGEHTAETVRDVLVDLMATLPGHLRGSLTWDQGSEMAAHKSFKISSGVPVYFCDPASPWQRGSNENTNGLLRQYFPKGTDLSAHGPLDLEMVAQKLNRRPRKTLGWDSPAERLLELI